MSEYLPIRDFERPFCDYAELYIWNSVKSHLKMQHALQGQPLFTRRNTPSIPIKNPYTADANGISTVYWQDFLHPSGICTTGLYAGCIVKPGFMHKTGILGRPMLADGGQWDSYTALQDLKLISIDRTFQERLAGLMSEPTPTTYASVLMVCMDKLGIPVDVSQWMENIG